MQYENLILLGTSHIAKQSIEEVKHAISSYKPKIVAIELDKSRLISLLSENRKTRISDIVKIGVKGYIFSLIGAWAEKKMGSMVGVKPGTEMITAYNLAKKNNIPVALIDQDIRITLKRFSKKLTWKEKFRFVGDIFRNFFKRKKIPFDLTKVPDEKIIKKLTNELKKRYPNVHQVLVEERNVYMAKQLAKLSKNDGLILAVMGAGHLKEILDLIIKEKKKLNELVTPSYSYSIIL